MWNTVYLSYFQYRKLKRQLIEIFGVDVGVVSRHRTLYKITRLRMETDSDYLYVVSSLPISIQVTGYYNFIRKAFCSLVKGERRTMIKLLLSSLAHIPKLMVQHSKWIHSIYYIIRMLQLATKILELQP